MGISFVEARKAFWHNMHTLRGTQMQKRVDPPLAKEDLVAPTPKHGAYDHPLTLIFFIWCLSQGLGATKILLVLAKESLCFWPPARPESLLHLTFFLAARVKHPLPFCCIMLVYGVSA